MNLEVKIFYILKRNILCGSEVQCMYLEVKDFYILKRPVCLLGVAGDGGIRRRFGGSSGGGGGGGRSEANELPRPKLELNHTIDREAEERRLKDILRLVGFGEDTYSQVGWFCRS